MDDSASTHRSVLVSAAYRAHADDRQEYSRGPFVLQHLSLEDLVDHLHDSKIPPQIRMHGVAWLLDAKKTETIDGLKGPIASVLGALPKDPRASSPGYEQLRAHVDGAFGRLRGAVSVGQGYARAMDLLQRLLPTPPQNLAAPAGNGGPGGGVARAPCRRGNYLVQVAFDWATLVTHVTAEIDSSDPMSGFNDIADPRNWHRNSPQFFRASDLVIESRQGGLALAGGLAQGAPYRTNVADGGPYLNEDVSLSWNPLFPLDGKNLLTVRYNPYQSQTKEYGMEVSLRRCLSTTIGLSATSGGIDVDSGQFKVSRATGAGFNTHILADKHARFTRRDFLGIELGYWLNVFTPFWLAPWLGLLVWQGACP